MTGIGDHTPDRIHTAPQTDGTGQPSQRPLTSRRYHGATTDHHVHIASSRTSAPDTAVSTQSPRLPYTTS